MKPQESTNKNGLSRTIPEEVKREVRQRCGFGCVVCGNPFIQYEHFSPEFKDATVHSADGITLLCGSCHDRKTKGLLSVATVTHYNLNPRPVTKGLAWGTLDIGTSHPEIELASNICKECHNIIRILGQDLMVIEPPEDDTSIFQTSITLKDRNGKESLIIEKNEIVYAKNWDVNWIGNRLTIRSGPRAIDLQLQIVPPRRLIISRLKMKYLSYRITIDNNIVEIRNKKQVSSGHRFHHNFFYKASPIIDIYPDRVVYGGSIVIALR